MVFLYRFWLAIGTCCWFRFAPSHWHLEPLLSVGYGVGFQTILGSNLNHSPANGRTALALEFVAPVADIIGFFVIPADFLALGDIPNGDKNDAVHDFRAWIAGMIDETKRVASVEVVMKHQEPWIDIHRVVNVELFSGNRFGEMIDFFLGDDDAAENPDDFAFLNFADGVNSLPFHPAFPNFQRFAHPRLYFHLFVTNRPFNRMLAPRGAANG